MSSFRQSQNEFLGKLPRACFELLHPHLATVEFNTGMVMVEAGTAFRRIWFPHCGVVSLVLGLDDDVAIDVGIVGRDGVIGITAVEADVARTAAIVRCPGTASAIDRDVFRHAWQQSEQLRAALTGWLWRQLGAAELNAACNAAHPIESRLCRRLLMLRDLAGSDLLPLTQQHLAQMLGVRRNSVSLAAIALRREGLLRYSRGSLQILDREGLLERACCCYTAREVAFRQQPVRPTAAPM